MSTETPDDTERALREAQAERLLDAWRTPTGWRYWSAVNNSEVGLWYTANAFLFMLFAGVLALLVRAQLAVPDNDFLSAELYNQVFTLHGTVMMFLFAVPVFEAFSIAILLEMLAARDLPFPRLSAYGYWCFLIGGMFVCGSIFFGVAPRAGWFMYPPLATQVHSGVGADIWLLGLGFIEVAAIAAAIELIVGVLKCRPPGVRINLMPLYAWYVLVVAGMIVFAFPPLIAGDLLFEIERAFDWPFFDPVRGGDPLLWQHLFWILGHPEVYIIFLPAIALVAMIVPTFAQRPVFGYAWIVLAAVGVGFLSFGLWVHHMFTTGLPAISLGFFSVASQAVAIPTGVQIFAFLGTLLLGRVIFSVPVLYVTGALAIFVIGGLTGVMVALAPFDWQAHDTYFVVAHLHYVLIGGMLFPVVAGVYYFFPFMTGKKLSDRLGRLAFWPMFIGFNVAFFPMHITGLRGMPRRVFTYPESLGFDWLNLISTVGSFIFAAGFLVVVIDVLRPKGKEPYAERNPWNARALEWLTEMPDQPWGVRTVPVIESRYPLWDQKDFMRDVDEGRFYIPDAEERQREALVTSVLDARPEQCLRVPGPTFLTMIAAIFTGGAFIYPTFHMYAEGLISAGTALVFILIWLWTGTAMVPEKEHKDVSLGLTLPLYASGPHSVGWWAMFITSPIEKVAEDQAQERRHVAERWQGAQPEAKWPAPRWTKAGVRGHLGRDRRLRHTGRAVACLLELPEMDAAAYRRLAVGETTGRDARLDAPAGPDALVDPFDVVLAECARCHGRDGAGRGVGAFPRLYGQSEECLLATLAASHGGLRNSGIMQPQAAVLDETEMQRLAAHYAAADFSPAEPADTPPAAMLELGEIIARQGVPKDGIPACVTCHASRQTERYPFYPSLDERTADYLASQLPLFKQGTRGGTAYAHIMQTIADRMSDAQIAAVAAYFSALPMEQEALDDP